MLENAKLVQKIENIHFRPPQYNAEGRRGSSAQSRRGSSAQSQRSKRPGSLNFVSRKNENMRIFKQNLVMFEKLKQSKPNLRKTDFDDHFSQHKRYQATVSKAGVYGQSETRV